MFRTRVLQVNDETFWGTKTLDAVVEYIIDEKADFISS